MTSTGSIFVLPQTNQLRSLHTVVRDREAPISDFVRCSSRIIGLLLESALDRLPYDKREVTTPVGADYEGLTLGADVCGVSVVRAGESMEPELRRLVPGIPIGKILIQRDKQTKLPRLYYSHLPPDIANRRVLLLEPRLATAGSALTAIQVLGESGVAPRDIVLVNFLASPSGLDKLLVTHPEVTVVTSSVEDGMNENAFMLPGIGDFGDRFFGTVPAALS